jgi:hypothetical protein
MRAAADVGDGVAELVADGAEELAHGTTAATSAVPERDAAAVADDVRIEKVSAESPSGRRGGRPRRRDGRRGRDGRSPRVGGGGVNGRGRRGHVRCQARLQKCNRRSTGGTNSSHLAGFLAPAPVPGTVTKLQQACRG